MRKTLTALLAALVLLAGAFAASAVVGGVASAQTDDGDEGIPDFPRHAQIVDEVLDDLVDQNVINQSQSDQIAAALTARAIEVREEMRQWHEENPGHGRFGRGFRQGFHLGALLDDGVIDEEELASLPDDHPLKDPDGPAADYLSGGLTLEELNQIREQHRAERWGTDT